MPTRSTPANNSFRNRFFLSLVTFLAFLAVNFLILIQKQESPVQKEFSINEPAPRTVFSPFHLNFMDEEETLRLKREKESKVLPVYTIDRKVKPQVLSRLEESLEKLRPTEKPRFSKTDLEKVSASLRSLAERFLGDGILEDAKKKDLIEGGKSRLHKFLPAAKQTEEREVKSLPSLSEVREKIAAALEKEGIRNPELKRVASEAFNQSLQPNLFYDAAQTKERLKQASDSISGVTVEVKRGEMVTQKGLLVNPKDQLRLIQIQKRMAKKQLENRLSAVGLFVLLGFAVIFLYLRQFQPKELGSVRFVLLVFSSCFVTLLFEKMTLQIHSASAPYLLPGALAAILLTILWNPTAGILGALAMPFFSAPLVDFRPEVVLAIFFGSVVGGFASRRIRKRIHFLKVGLAVGVSNAIVLAAVSSFQEMGQSEILQGSLVGLGNGFLVTALAFFLVPLFEQLFNLTTDITLLELSDLNHPLLKRMVVEAPGTYHHSLVVSTLAEAACEAIGANALLARVGSYFHDIGKIARSEYFTENQTPQTRMKHEPLTPTMSCLVIMNHVKDGMELAKRYKLKDVIIRFIPEHQGKGVVYYFYKKALDQAAPGETVRVDDFRYPGPKPQSRETAVALLSDSVEAASRSLKEITPAAIRSLVRKIINEKFIDGQLDECDLTLKDLHKIQESFVHNLMAIFHTRVNYPTLPQDPRHPDLFEADQFKKFH